MSQGSLRNRLTYKAHENSSINSLTLREAVVPVGGVLGCGWFTRRAHQSSGHNAVERVHNDVPQGE